ncbi:hypothetical protein [Streptomyces avermitilis]|uniref:AB hydrolase-1 domain-containing protein n=1 Tax=Streptomyces avermitilis TaxID=33903 RepID=A0A4D4MAL0_STRAX|nr:hypothetical protein [Streptomyces avermitilis]GDY68926.1 hypothetical protein SAV14893_083190 [Streptomyces avermitilis]GDY70689.1 hypothetical protein SAV31267_001740 [Streptomyces avermitilis]
MAESNVRPRPTTWATAPNRRIVVGSNTLVYRDLGPENGVPLVLLTHLGATLDEWDPDLSTRSPATAASSRSTSPGSADPPALSQAPSPRWRVRRRGSWPPSA